MAVGVTVIPEKALLNMLNATALLSANAANFKLALIGSGWVPNNATNELFADVSANQIAAGGGYTSGGASLTGVTLALENGKVKFTAGAVAWNASGSGFPAWRRGVIYYNGTLNGKVNPIVGHFLGDATNVDIPPTTLETTPLTITPASAGVILVG